MTASLDLRSLLDDVTHGVSEVGAVGPEIEIGMVTDTLPLMAITANDLTVPASEGAEQDILVNISRNVKSQVARPYEPAVVTKCIATFGIGSVLEDQTLIENIDSDIK